MKLLLDTSIFLWYVSGDKILKLRQKSAIQNPKNEVYVSAVSIWEVCIKHLRELPLYHHDPFDRMLICQSVQERCTLVTSDALIRRYDIQVL
jgi:PIN domain nuclease of toxin-antitoxin system